MIINKVTIFIPKELTYKKNGVVMIRECKTGRIRKAGSVVIEVYGRSTGVVQLDMTEQGYILTL